MYSKSLNIVTMLSEKPYMHDMHSCFLRTGIGLTERPLALKALFMSLIFHFAIYLSLHINVSKDEHRFSHRNVIVSKPRHGHIAHSILRIPSLCPDSYFDS